MAEVEAERFGRAAYFQSGYYLAGHRGIEGIEFLRAVQLDGADTVNVVEKDVVRVITRLLLGYISIRGSFGHLFQMSVSAHQ